MYPLKKLKEDAHPLSCCHTLNFSEIIDLNVAYMGEIGI